MTASLNKKVNIERTSDNRRVLSKFAVSKPNAALSRELARRTANLMKVLLHECLVNCEEALGEDLTHCRKFVERLSVERPLHPQIYATVFHLRSGIETQNTDLVYDWLASLIRMTRRREFQAKSIFKRVTSILTDEWEQFNVDAMRKYDQLNIRGERTQVMPLLNARALAKHRRNISEALRLLEECDPEVHSEVVDFVYEIKLFQGRVLRGETSSITFGVVWLRVPEPEQDQVAYWIEHLVHEVSHLRLESVFMFEKLLLNPVTEKCFRAPIRDDLRPMRGVFHATFVLARIIRVFRRLSKIGMDKRLRDQLRLFELQFEIGMTTLNDQRALFSVNGARIRDSLRACCQS